MLTDFPIFRTSRLLLRQFVESDLENVFNGLSDSAVIKYYGVHFTKQEETKKQLEWFDALEKNGTGIWWAISSLDGRDFYGAAGLYYLKNEHKKAETGFWLLPEFWRRGIMTEALPLIVDYGFNTRGLHRIEAFVETENKGSKRTMEKLQFVLEGTMCDCEIKNGRFISLDIYARLR
jgi:[ribosomal protein S5]-alanine N-acetyltransferase